MIDLRSDTFTKPNSAMLQAMINAEVGDDVWGEDPTVNLLQEQVAKLFDKEASLFVPSGTMSNQLSLKVLTEPGNEVITDADAHIYYYETAAPAILSNLMFRTIKTSTGEMPLDELEKLIRPNIYYFAETKVISLENTHNRHSGTILSLDYIKSVRELADKYGIRMHLDGARIWNASVATGIALVEYASYFDTVSVCLSKGLGAPVGSLIISDRKRIEKALKWRKILGGGMRQAGYMAACGLHAIEHNLPLLESDHKNAKLLATEISNINGIEVEIKKVQTNIVVFKIYEKFDSKLFCDECKKHNLQLADFGNNMIRAVTYYHISETDILNAVGIIDCVMKKMMS